MRLNRLSEKRVPWGAVATLSGEALSRASLAFFQFLVANGLGAERFGTVGLALAFAALFLPLADLGLGNLAVRRLANSGSTLDFSFLLGIKLAFTALYGIVVVSCAVLALQGEDAAMACLAGLYWALNSLTEFSRQCLRAGEKSMDEFRARLWQPLSFVVAMAVFWWGKPGGGGALLLWTLPFAVLLGAYRRPLRHAFGQVRPRLAGAGLFLKGQAGFMWQSASYLFLVVVAGRLDLWLIEARADRAAVGAYFAVYSMVFTGVFFAQALSVHMYPGLHRSGALSIAPLRSLARALAAHAGLGGGLFVIVAGAGPWFYPLVFRVEGFGHTPQMFLSMGALLGVSTLNYLWLSILIGLNRQWLISAAMLGFLVPVKLVLGWLWLPVHGTVGMVWAGLCAEVPVTLLLGLVASRLYLKRGGGSDPR